jgi:hypothetical protein
MVIVGPVCLAIELNVVVVSVMAIVTSRKEGPSAIEEGSERTSNKSLHLQIIINPYLGSPPANAYTLNAINQPLKILLSISSASCLCLLRVPPAGAAKGFLPSKRSSLLPKYFLNTFLTLGLR